MQPDTIIPDLSNPQSWNRYSYAEDDPINYSDSSGHFKCKNNSTSFTGDCHEAIETYLTLLQEKGGKEGEALVKAFRDADTVTKCGRGGCSEFKDQISITIIEKFTDKDGNPSPTVAQYQAPLIGNPKYVVTAGMMNSTGEAQLVSAGSFGHEIVHQTQGWFQVETLLSELDAYVTQSKLYKNMGIGSSEDNNVKVANYIASYKYKSDDEIINSAWGRQYGMPLRRFFTPDRKPDPYLRNEPR